MQTLTKEQVDAVSRMPVDEFESLEAVEPGDYGWVVFEDVRRNKLLAVWYDDDAEGYCICGKEFCESEGKGHVLVEEVILYQSPDSVLLVADYEIADLDQVRRVPALLNIRPPTARVKRRDAAKAARRELVYAVALDPEVLPRRIKIGWTRSLASRVKSFRTTSPGCVLLAAWPATRELESTAHQTIKGRIGQSEVFDVGNVDAALAELDALLGRRA